MPSEYTIDKAGRLVTSRFWGAVTETEVLDHNRRVRADRDFDPTYRQLADLTGVTEILVGTDLIRQTSLDQFFAPGARRAFVASSDGVYGMVRMFALQAEGAGHKIEVFRNRRDAEQYLGI